MARAVSPIRLISRGRSRTTALEAHQRDFAGVEQRLQALALQMAAADADELDLACRVVRRSARTRSAPSRSPDSSPATMAMLQRAGTAHALVSRQADDEQAEPHRRARSRRPCRGSSERPASTPMPASPARMSRGRRSAGPIAGRSARNSCPGLAHLTSTPRFLPASRPCARSVTVPAEQAVGPFDAFQRDGAAADRHRRLAVQECIPGSGTHRTRNDRHANDNRYVPVPVS